MPECPNCGCQFTETPEWQAAVREKDKHDALLALGNELRNGDVIVCTKHLRFIPCRKGQPYKNDPCVLSENPEDIAYVHRYQRGEVD